MYFEVSVVLCCYVHSHYLPLGVMLSSFMLCSAKLCYSMMSPVTLCDFPWCYVPLCNVTWCFVFFYFSLRQVVFLWCYFLLCNVTYDATFVALLSLFPFLFHREVWDPGGSSVPPVHLVRLGVCLGLLQGLQPAPHAGDHRPSKQKLITVKRSCLNGTYSRYLCNKAMQYGLGQWDNTLFLHLLY